MSSPAASPSPRTPPPIHQVAARSRQVIQHHAEVRRSMSRGELDLRGAVAQCLFDADLGSLRIVRALSALPRISPAVARTMMAEARIPLSRRLSWLANHPQHLERLEQMIWQRTGASSTRQPPHPRWPWYEEATS